MTRINITCNFDPGGLKRDSYSVMVGGVGGEAKNPGSNPGFATRTWSFKNLKKSAVFFSCFEQNPSRNRFFKALDQNSSDETATDVSQEYSQSSKPKVCWNGEAWKFPPSQAFYAVNQLKIPPPTTLVLAPHQATSMAN